MIKLPIDIVQLIGLHTHDTRSYLNLALTSKQHSKLLLKTRRCEALRVFTEINIDRYKSKEWHINGKRHREDGPALEWANGNKEWYINGKRHREDGPAYIDANGNKFWYINGKPQYFT